MFRAVTRYAGKFKSLFEVLFQNMITARLTIDKKGIFLEEYTNQNILISVFLPAEKFEEFTFNDDEPIHLGLGNHINKEFFKSIKNKDVIIMTINNPYVFEFEKRNNNDESVQTLSTKTESIQNITPMNHPEFTSLPIKIKSSDFNQTCKSFNAPTLTVTKDKGCINFSFDTGRSIKTLKSGKEDLTNLALIHQTYYDEQFTRINKISSFVTEPIEVFMEADKPLYLLCKSSIGNMKIFIYEQSTDE